MGIRIQSLMTHRNRMFLLGSIVIIVNLIMGYFWLVDKMYMDEKSRINQETTRSVKSFANHTEQVVSQVDSLLRSVRMFYLNSGSATETDIFIQGLNLDTSVVEDIFLTNSRGRFIIPFSLAARTQNVRDREYFIFHQSNAKDELNISAVETGLITGKDRFRITRRIFKRDGSFAGVVIATINPQAFTNYFKEFKIGPQNVVSLIGTQDRKLRARIPVPTAEKWKEPVNILIWNALKKSNQGMFEDVSSVDNINRVFIYKKVAALPLVLAIGLSNIDVNSRTVESKKLLLVVLSMAIVFVIVVTASLIALNISRDKLKASHRSLSELYLRIQEVALYDQLTALPSRTLFLDRFQHMVQSAKRDDVQGFLMYLDLDGFKHINDKYGHNAGDELLKALSNRMGKVVRPGDTICRWGGDEFLVLIPNLEDTEEALKIAKRLLIEAKEPIGYEDKSLGVTASIGIAKFPEDGESFEELQKAADLAMYTAKNHGKNQVAFVMPRTNEQN